MRSLATVTLQRLARVFLAGTLAILPLVITVGIVLWVVDFLHRALGPGTLIGDGLTKLGLRFSTNDTVAYSLGFVVVFAVVLLIGVAVEAGARNILRRLIDRILKRIPIIGSIYGTSKQLVDVFDKSDATKLQGMQAVMCFFGESGACGILALLVSPQKYSIRGREYQIVIVPTAPVPFGGGLFFIPSDAIQPAGMSVEGLMSVYVSMGVSAPQFLHGGDAAS